MTATPSGIELIRRHQIAFHLALAGALLHNLGKVSSRFIEEMTKELNVEKKFLFQHVVGLLDKDASDQIRGHNGINWNGWNKLSTSQKDLEVATKIILSTESISFPAPFDDRCYRLGDYIEYLGVQEPWYKKTDHQFNIFNIEKVFPEKGSLLTHLMSRAHGAASGGEKHCIALEKQEQKDNLWLATPFGWERPAKGCESGAKGGAAIDELRLFVEGIINCQLTDSKTFSLEQFSQVLRPAFEQALADTQRPINDISVWDIGQSGAAFLLALAVGLIEHGQPINHGFLDKDHTKDVLKWRVLRIGINGLAYLEQAARMADVRVRRDLLEKALNRARRIEQVPLALEIYRDENGASYVFPDVPEDSGIFTEAVSIIREAFLTTDLVPDIHLSDSLPILPVTDDEQETITKIRKSLTWFPSVLEYNLNRMAEAWQGQASGREKCSGCGLRPQGYGAENIPDYKHNAPYYRKKATSRNICCICMERQRGISEKWLKEAGVRETVWLDEVADEFGRLALVTGSFGLEEFFENHVYPSSMVRKDCQKELKGLVRSQSFARLRRVWESTEEFWQETQKLILELLPSASRLQIVAEGMDDNVKKNLGEYHAYELVLEGAVKMNVVWDPDFNNEDGRFVTADNIGRVEEQLDRKGNLAGYLAGRTITVREPGGYGGKPNDIGQIKVLRADSIDGFEYRPAISILARPRNFMILVPAASAWKAARLIKEKYEREMGKVQNRLPMQLGVVFAQHRTPVRAILDAGVRMMSRKRSTPDEWKVTEVETLTQEDLEQEQKEQTFLCRANEHFKEIRAVTLHNEPTGKKTTWYVPLKMGDGKEDDEWYPLVALAASGENGAEEVRGGRIRGRNGREETFVHVLCLQPEDTIRFAPSSLDWVWLDSSGRRFEIAYDADNGVRLDPEMRRRPYLLDEMEAMDKIWDILAKGLSRSQITGIRTLVDEKRREWLADESGEGMTVFRLFCRDALVNLEWCKGAKITGPILEGLTDHAVSGLLNDTVELNLQVLKKKLEHEEKERAHE